MLTFENLTGWKEESPAPSQPPQEEQLDCRGTSRTSTNLQQVQGLVRYFENPKKMTAVIQRTFREHHNSSKYLHWCTGLACGNLLFPPSDTSLSCMGGDSESNDAFIFFIQPNDIRLINLVWGREKSICLYIGVMMQQCNDNSPLIHEPFLCQKVLDIRSKISSQNWPELSAFGMAASWLSLLPAGAAKLAGAAAALLCWRRSWACSVKLHRQNAGLIVSASESVQ